MKKTVLAVLAINALACCIGIASPIRVRFEITSGSVPPGSQVCIAGNNAILGSWAPGKVALNKISDSTWAGTFEFNKEENLEFKFTLGSWAGEALEDDGSPRGNSRLTLTKDSTLSFRIEKWGAGQAFKGQITGRTEIIKDMPGDSIKPRDVIIWFPPSYSTEVSKRYPVLYMHDGQNIIDPATSSFGVDWQIDETADSLIRRGKMNEIIIVGIYNTKDRSEDYSYTVKGRQYEKFIVEKLKPLIDKNYRTLPDRKNTATMGSSMGGLISLMLAWEYPEVFSAAACLSPAFKVDKFDYTPFIENYKGTKKNIRIYADAGSIGIEEELQPGIYDMLKLLREKGYRDGMDLMWYKDKGAEHNESSWAKRLWRPLLFMFGK